MLPYVGRQSPLWISWDFLGFPLDLTPKLWYNTRMKNNTTLTPGSRGSGFHINFPDGFTLSVQFGVNNYCHNQDYSMGVGNAPLGETSTVEIALMNPKGSFVVLQHDVAGWVPVSVLGSLISAVEAHDWERFKLLCGETDEPDYSKFPEKGVDYA